MGLEAGVSLCSVLESNVNLGPDLLGLALSWPQVPPAPRLGGEQVPSRPLRRAARGLGRPVFAGLEPDIDDQHHLSAPSRGG